MPKICPRYAQDMPEICPRYVQDMPEICLRYAQDMLKICPRYAKEICKNKLGQNVLGQNVHYFYESWGKMSWGKMSPRLFFLIKDEGDKKSFWLFLIVKVEFISVQLVISDSSSQIYIFINFYYSALFWLQIQSLSHNWTLIFCPCLELPCRARMACQKSVQKDFSE